MQKECRETDCHSYHYTTNQSANETDVVRERGIKTNSCMRVDGTGFIGLQFSLFKKRRSTRKKSCLTMLKVIEYCLVRFQVLTAASIKMTIFRDVASCSLVVVFRHFRCACCVNHQGALMTDVGSTSETSVNFYQTTRRNNPENSNLQNNVYSKPVLPLAHNQ
jgi:hypothetical protein